MNHNEKTVLTELAKQLRTAFDGSPFTRDQQEAMSALALDLVEQDSLATSGLRTHERIEITPALRLKFRHMDVTLAAELAGDKHWLEASMLLLLASKVLGNAEALFPDAARAIDACIRQHGGLN